MPALSSDDDLTAAIASQKSWRGVARELGYQPNSSGAIRKLKLKAAELGLSTAHFTAQRTWSDQQLREAIESCDSWSAVARALNLRESGDIHVRLRGVALRLGIDASHLNPSRLPPPPVEAGGTEPVASNLRHAAESLASAWFALCGLPSAVPVQPAAYDLLVTFPDGLKRVQVKSSTYRGDFGSYHVGIGQRPYVLDKTASRQPYDPGSLDLFFIVDGDGLMYLIPVAAVAGRTSINVGAYRRFVVGDCSGLFVPAHQLAGVHRPAPSS